VQLEIDLNLHVGKVSRVITTSSGRAFCEIVTGQEVTIASLETHMWVVLVGSDQIDFLPTELARCSAVIANFCYVIDSAPAVTVVCIPIKVVVKTQLMK
jgi:hypothetical protein